MIEPNANVKTDAAALVRRLWHYCNVLRDDGLSYPDYVEQLTYLLFLKMSQEKGRKSPVPPKYSWSTLSRLDARAMARQYSAILTSLGERDGVLGVIFRNATNKIRDPAKLRFLVAELFDQMEWSGLSGDVKGDAYEGLLDKNARDTKSGAGQYFTPRPLIEAIVACVDPRPGEVVCDPACGTGGFLLAAHGHIRRQTPKLTARQRAHLNERAIRGVELVQEVARLASMNLLLHGIPGDGSAMVPVTCADSLVSPPSSQVDVVLTNPPFGIKGSVTYTSDGRSGRSGDELVVLRKDFWVETANKQLNFMQHVFSLLRPGGRAAVVVPDNVLFESGAAAAIRRRLLQMCDMHTLLRLPAGLFYAHGVKANVLFFDRRTTKERPGRMWVYDLRAENRFSLKTRPIEMSDLSGFVRCYRRGNLRGRSIDDDQARWFSVEHESLLSTEKCSFDVALSVRRPPQGTGLERLEDLSNAIASDLRRALDLILAAGRGHQ